MKGDLVDLQIGEGKALRHPESQSPVGVLIRTDHYDFMDRQYPNGVVPVWAIMPDGAVVSPIPSPDGEGNYVFVDVDDLYRQLLGDQAIVDDIAANVISHLDEYAAHEKSEDERVAAMTSRERKLELAKIAAGHVLLSESEVIDATNRLRGTA